MSRLRTALPLIWVALPALAAAEGNRLTLACDLLDPAGPAAPEDAQPGDTPAAALPLPAHPVFTFAPVKLDRAGAGPVAVTAPDGQTAPGVTASFQGPYAWTLGTILHTLTVKGPTADGRTLVLWHRLDQAQTDVPPAGQLLQLTCEVS